MKLFMHMKYLFIHNHEKYHWNSGGKNSVGIYIKKLYLCWIQLYHMNRVWCDIFQHSLTLTRVYIIDFLEVSTRHGFHKASRFEILPKLKKSISNRDLNLFCFCTLLVSASETWTQADTTLDQWQYNWMIYLMSKCWAWARSWIELLWESLARYATVWHRVCHNFEKSPSWFAHDVFYIYILTIIQYHRWNIQQLKW